MPLPSCHAATYFTISFFHNILTNTKFKQVTSTYYRSEYLVFAFTINVTYFRRVCSSLMYAFVFSVVSNLFKVSRVQVIQDEIQPQAYKRGQVSALDG